MNLDSFKHGALLHRDSGGKHDQTIGQYVEWAMKQCQQYGLHFVGCPEVIHDMARSKQFVRGDIYLDYGISGNQLSRPGLGALMERAKSDLHLTHIFVPRPDRLARPDDPMDGLRLENYFRQLGKTLVYMNKVLEPVKRGNRPDVGEAILSYLDFDRASEERRSLSQKIIFAQINLARAGYSTGGRPPYGFRRHLIGPGHQIVRQLADGERVRMAGHHVVLLPGPDEEVRLALRIRELLRTMPATQVAKLLNAEGIPSPDAGRHRTDKGTTHLVSGKWNQTSIVNIGRNPLFAALTRYGLRSMGDQLRFTIEGPRILEESDRHPGSDKPKVIRNPESQQIQAEAKFESLESDSEHRELQTILNQRSGTQRRKPRSREPHRNPLGGRIFDMACGWPMYRIQRSPGFNYTCGLYQQSHTQSCDHNHVDGPLATKFALSCVQQILMRPGFSDRLRQKLQRLTEQSASDSSQSQELKRLQSQLVLVASDRKKAAKNMALADSLAQSSAMKEVFNELMQRKLELTRQIESLAGSVQQRKPEDQVEQLMQVVENLQDLAKNTDDLAAVGQLFDQLNLRLFFRFQRVKLKKRLVNRVAGGPPSAPHRRQWNSTRAERTHRA